MDTESAVVTENMMSAEDPFMGGFIQVGSEKKLIFRVNVDRLFEYENVICVWKGYTCHALKF